MRNLLVLSVLLVSMCVSAQQASVIIEDDSQTDLFIKAEAIPAEVRSGRNLDMVFEVRNKRADTVRNITLLAYDQCLFSGDNTKTFVEIRPNEPKRWSWKWLAGDVNVRRDCNIGFKVDYEADFYRTQTLSVLTESEYNQRESAGTLDSVPRSSSTSSNPIDILFSFSQNLP